MSKIEFDKFHEFLNKVQGVLTNTLARETEELMHVMPKSQSDKICALACALVFANGIALIKTSNLSDEVKKEMITLMHKTVDLSVPKFVKELEELNKNGIWEKVMKGEIESAHKKMK